MSRFGCRRALAALFCLTSCATSPQAETVTGPVQTTAPAPSPPDQRSAPGTAAPAQTDATNAGSVAGFTAKVSPVTAADLPSSWRPGCPVAPDQLRLVRLTHLGFDDEAHEGSLVVNASAVQAMVDVFRRLFDQRFPIRRMEPIDVFGGDDAASTAADNTAAFNCRNAVAAGPAHWSMHAYGLAIDVNPVENPYIFGGEVLPPAGQAYVDRSTYRPGMAVEGGVLTSAFADVGWYWGGRWAAPDYQHFSSTGN